jgi:hypothetical protein
MPSSTRRRVSAFLAIAAMIVAAAVPVVANAGSNPQPAQIHAQIHAQQIHA